MRSESKRKGTCPWREGTWLCAKKGGQKRVYRTPESGVTSWRRIRLLLAVLAE